MNIDKIPVKEMTYSPGDESYHLGTIVISKGEYANAEKINELVECFRELQEKVFKLEKR